MGGEELFETLNFGSVSVAFIGATLESFFEAEDFLFQGFYVHFFPLTVRSTHMIRWEV